MEEERVFLYRCTYVWTVQYMYISPTITLTFRTRLVHYIIITIFATNGKYHKGTEKPHISNIIIASSLKDLGISSPAAGLWGFLLPAKAR